MARLTFEEKAFELELEDMLRSTGHLFPVTPEQVAAFRKLGLDEEVPDDCKDPLDELIKKKRKRNSVNSIRVFIYELVVACVGAGFFITQYVVLGYFV